MVDWDVIIAKAASVRFHLDRIAAKTDRGLDDFLSDIAAPEERLRRRLEERGSAT
jgi:hypothetical protein